jgi:glucosamine-6-phosphate deaminase
MELLRAFKKDKLNVKVYDSPVSLGNNAAGLIIADIQKLLSIKNEISIMFAAAPSQNTTLQAFINNKSIPWGRINAFHMDEYVGLRASDRQSFRYYLNENIFRHKKFKSVNLINGESENSEKEANRYQDLLNRYGLDLVILGIGENGHIAFNDPPFAKFNDQKLVRVIELSLASRNQQVHDKCFTNLEDVPTHAITVTIPAIFSASYLHCVVPGKLKAKAIKDTLENSISENCPASILRRHKNSTLHLDIDSSSLLTKGH